MEIAFDKMSLREVCENEARAIANPGGGAVGELSDDDLEQVSGGWGTHVRVNMNNW